MSKQAFVYILASKRNGTLYTGVTSNLYKRMYEHKTKAHLQSFTAKYTVDKLVWYSVGDNMTAAIELEKKIKNRNRAWKIALIEKTNPNWEDLSLDFMDSAIPLRYTQNDEDNVRNDDPTTPSSCTQLQGLILNMDSATKAQNDEDNVRNDDPTTPSPCTQLQGLALDMDSAIPLRYTQNDEALCKETQNA